MRYTHDQYNKIIADARYTTAFCLATERPQPFKCVSTTCEFCPFSHGVRACWKIYRTADEWGKWLEDFTANNDPGHPYTVEIPADVVDVIDTALHIETLDSDTRGLLRLIQKQINDQNRD